MDHIIYTTLNAFRESWLDVDTSVWDILAGRIRELLLCPKCHEPIFTNSQQKNITILIDRPSQDTKPLNHNADIVEVPIIKEQEVLEPISYLENSTLHNNSRNGIETSSAENDLISDFEIKQQTQDITNLQDISHPILNNPVLSEQNAKIKVPEIDIQPLIQELLIKPSEEDCVKVVNGEENTSVDQSPAIKLAYLYKKMKFAEIRTIRAKQDKIMSCEILPEILKNRLITNKKAYELATEVPAFSQLNKTVILYDACTFYINVTLKEYPYLSLFNSDIHNNGYEFKNSGSCLGCKKEHNKGK
ncbi:17241_t:CDS:2, partial [Funneliformis geosporum]